METIGLAMMELAPGISTQTLRTTVNNVYAVVEGTGESDVDEQKIEWNRGDVFVAPSWRPHSHRSERGAVLLRVTDEPVMSKLNLLRAQVKSGTGTDWEWIAAKSN
jgi:gentisate 1,2-dioxygenase